jgi:large subunit ribosomal protein L18e
MSKRTGPTNPILKSAIESLKKRGSGGVKIWEDVARKLSASTRSRVEVNIANINRNSKDGETIVVPGVVLSAGNIEKKVNVAAWRFSGTADKKITEAGGKTFTIDELKKENPKGTNVKLMV